MWGLCPSAIRSNHRPDITRQANVSNRQGSPGQGGDNQQRRGGGLIVSNEILWGGNVDFTVTDSKGQQQFPQLNWVADKLAPSPTEPDWRRVLGNWLVLFPKYSFASQLTLDGETFPFLKKPGRYKLSATYSSAGLDYGANSGELGLKAKDVTALPFRSWSGKIQSNSVWITIVPGPKSGEQ